MNFKEYLQEFYYPPVMEDSEYISPEISKVINGHISGELTNTVLTPETGFQTIRKLLHRSGWDMPATYDLDPEGDEQVFDIHELSNDKMCGYLYVIYYLTDDGDYDFYAEVGDAERMEELTSGEEEDEEQY